MATKNSKLIKVFDFYLNEINRENVEFFYGKGTKIKIHSIGYSITETSILIEAIIILGDSINEEVLDRSMAEALVIDCVPYIFPEIQSVRVMTRWDV